MAGTSLWGRITTIDTWVVSRGVILWFNGVHQRIIVQAVHVRLTGLTRINKNVVGTAHCTCPLWVVFLVFLLSLHCLGVCLYFFVLTFLSLNVVWDSIKVS